jgi:uncharacterized protein (DUF2062 family)
MARSAAALAPGSLVLGRYRPIRPLGSGGSGSVWLAREEESGREVALKIVPREGTAGSRAEREAAAAARLRHERCLRAHALARDARHVYIVSEYVPGRTLREAMRAGQLDDGRILEAAAQILEGLAHAHAHGVVHRDVKPANVLLVEGRTVSVKLFDFGLALLHEEESLTAIGDIPGTLAYMSPERLRGETAGAAADVWAVGVLLWEALAGRHPFWGGTLIQTARKIEQGAPSLRDARPDLPRPIVACVDRALALDPKRRPSAAILASKLRQTSTRRRSRPVRRSRVTLRTKTLALRALPAVAAGVFAGFVAATVPFFPAGWALALGALAAVVSIANERIGLALALAVPVLPLGNYSLGLALLYALVAAAWLALCWREPRSSLFLTLGPALSPLGALGLLPAAGLAIRNPARRAAGVIAAVLAAAAASGLARLSDLNVEATDRPLEAGTAVVSALTADRQVLFQAIALAAAGLLLPFARGRGPWAALAFGAAMLAITLLPAVGLPPLPLVLATAITCAALVLEPILRARRQAALEAAAETAGIDRPPAATRNEPTIAREVVGGG